MLLLQKIDIVVGKWMCKFKNLKKFIFPAIGVFLSLLARKGKVVPLVMLEQSMYEFDFPCTQFYLEWTALAQVRGLNVAVNV